MTTTNRLLYRNASPSTDKISPRAHVLIWVLVTLAALLLVVFTAVVDDITDRGELRRVQQRASGAFTLAEDLQPVGVDVIGMLSMASGKLTQR